MFLGEGSKVPEFKVDLPTFDLAQFKAGDEPTLSFRMDIPDDVVDGIDYKISGSISGNLLMKAQTQMVRL